MPRIYVASLSDYNAGVLHGVWIDLGDDIDADGVWEQINAMLANSPTTRKYGDVAEEWAIHDHEDWGGLRISEYADIAKLVDIAELMEDHPPAAVAAYIDNEGWDYWSVDGFEESYRGSYTSVEAFAEELIEESCYDIPEPLQYYIDYEKYADDLRIGGDIWVHEESYDTIHIFWNI